MQEAFPQLMQCLAAKQIELRCMKGAVVCSYACLERGVCHKALPTCLVEIERCSRWGQLLFCFSKACDRAVGWMHQEIGRQLEKSARHQQAQSLQESSKQASFSKRCGQEASSTGQYIPCVKREDTVTGSFVREKQDCSRC